MTGYLQRLVDVPVADALPLRPALASESPIAEGDQRLQIDALAAVLPPAAPFTDRTADPAGAETVASKGTSAATPRVAPQAQPAPAPAPSMPPVVQRRAAAPSAGAGAAPVAPVVPIAGAAPAVAADDRAESAVRRDVTPAAAFPEQPHVTATAPDTAAVLPGERAERARPFAAEPVLDDPFDSPRSVDPGAPRAREARSSPADAVPAPQVAYVPVTVPQVVPATSTPGTQPIAEPKPIPPPREEANRLDTRSDGEPARVPGPAKREIIVREPAPMRPPVEAPPPPPPMRVPKTAAEASVIGPLSAPEQLRTQWDLWLR